MPPAFSLVELHSAMSVIRLLVPTPPPKMVPLSLVSYVVNGITTSDSSLLTMPESCSEPVLSNRTFCVGWDCSITCIV